MKPQAGSPAMHHLSIVVHICNPRTWFVRARESKFQCHPYLKGEFEARPNDKSMSQNSIQIYGGEGKRSQGSRRVGMDLPKGLIMDLGAVRKEHSSWGKESMEVMCWSGAQGPGEEAREAVVRRSCLGGRGEQDPSGRASWAPVRCTSSCSSVKSA